MSADSVSWERTDDGGVKVQLGWAGCALCLVWAIGMVLLGGLLVRAWAWSFGG